MTGDYLPDHPDDLRAYARAQLHTINKYVRLSQLALERVNELEFAIEQFLDAEITASDLADLRRKQWQREVIRDA